MVAAIVICFATMSRAQQKFNVQNGTKAEFYDDLETAIQKAVSGDTIYLPGGIIEVSSDIIIDKKLAIIGTGWDMDSIGGVKKTEIMSDKYVYYYGYFATINFRNGSNGSLFTGCIVGSINFGHKDEVNDFFHNIENVTISRNCINGQINLGVSGVQNNQVKKIFISENFLSGAIYGHNASECWINNNNIGCQAVSSSATTSLSQLIDSYVYNNVFRCSGEIYGLQKCTIINNFIASNGINASSYCTFNHNAFTSNITFPLGTNVGFNNLINQDIIQTFQDNNLDHPKNLVIRSTSPCKNAGTDGTDIGIYGGSAPYKPGAVPFHPHIDKAVITSQTDLDGKLKVEFKVSAQDR